MSKPILVVGGGISGVTAAVEAAEVGAEVILVEKQPTLGGRVAQLRYYFPKLCPPTCGLEINYRRIKSNPRIKVYTMAEVLEVSGTPGNYNVKIKIYPRYVNDNCTACGECEKVCEGERVSDFDFGLSKTKAIYLPHPVYEKFLKKAEAEAKINFIKGKVAKIEEDPETKDLIVTAEDTLSGKKVSQKVDLVVLALENAAKDQGAAVVYTKEFLCSKEGRAFIEEKIAQDGLDAVSICACSQRVNYDVFSFDQVAVDRVSLREGVVWSRFLVGENGEILEDTAEYVSGVTFKDELMALAKDYVSVAGLTAALEAAKAGYEVVLVEKEKELGGFVAKMKAHCEVNPPFQKLVPPIVNDLIAQVEANDKIKVYKGAVVTNISGAPGLFSSWFQTI